MAIGLVLLVVGSVLGGPAAASPSSSSVDSCTTIDESGVYTLSEDLESSDGTCIRITSSDVVLDGDGYTIEGPGEGTNMGVRTADGLTNVTVTDVAVVGWLVGIQFNDVDGGEIEAVTAAGNVNGIALRESADSRVAGVTARDNGHQGIRLLGTEDSVVTGSEAVENTADGILLKDAPDNELSDNVASRNGEDAGADGFLIRDGSHRTEILRNEANENTDDGFDIQNSSEIRIVGNNASFNVGVVNSDGIEIRYSHRNVIRNNTANNNVDDGIDLQVAHNNTVVDNVANANVNDGIPIAHSHDNSVRDNVANYNSKADREIVEEMLPGKEVEEEGSDGLTFRSNSTNNTMVNNTAKGNHRQGIRLWHHARHNEVRNNTAINNFNDGIAVLNSTGNLVEKNEIRDNRANGIHLNNYASDNELRHNSVQDNRLSGILLYTANDTLVAGNSVTGNAAGPRSNGIRVGSTHGAALALNSVYDNEATSISVTGSTGIQLLKPGAVEVTDSEDVTIVRSWRLTESSTSPHLAHPDRYER